MGYPLINGAPLNDSGQGGLSLQGLDLVTGGGATVVLSPTVGSSAPLELGLVAVKATIYPSGLDLVTTATHTARFDALIRPAGIDLVTAGTAMAATTVSALSATPLEFGAAKVQLGTDQAVLPDGQDLVRAGAVSALSSQPAPIIYVEAGPARPLEFGNPAIARGGLAVGIASANPLALGQPTTRQTALVGGATTMEAGSPCAATAAEVRPAVPMQVGVPRLRAHVEAEGFDLVRAGTAVASRGAVEAFVVGVQVLDLAEAEPLQHPVFVRPSFPFGVGGASIYRGVSC